MCKIFVKGKNGLVEVSGDVEVSMKPRGQNAYKAPPVPEPKSSRGIQLALAAKAAARAASAAPAASVASVTKVVAMPKLAPAPVAPGVPMFRTRRGQMLPVSMVGGSSASRTAGRH